RERGRVGRTGRGGRLSVCPKGVVVVSQPPLDEGGAEAVLRLSGRGGCNQNPEIDALQDVASSSRRRYGRERGGCHEDLLNEEELAADCSKVVEVNVGHGLQEVHLEADGETERLSFFQTLDLRLENGTFQVRLQSPVYITQGDGSAVRPVRVMPV